MENRVKRNMKVMMGKNDLLQKSCSIAVQHHRCLIELELHQKVRDRFIYYDSHWYC